MLFVFDVILPFGRYCLQVLSARSIVNFFNIILDKNRRHCVDITHTRCCATKYCLLLFYKVLDALYRKQDIQPYTMNCVYWIFVLHLMYLMSQIDARTIFTDEETEWSWVEVEVFIMLYFTKSNLHNLSKETFSHNVDLR